MIYEKKEEYKYSEITARIIGCAMKIHNELGPGFPEYIYQRALEIEFRNESIKNEREKEHPVYYLKELVGKRRVDFVVEEKIMLELKAVDMLNNLSLSRSINYLKAFNLEIGLLINFGGAKLEFKRLINNKM
ncbi:MAG: GxxExxY protein [Chitinophagaceae bacterium]|nr:GxxExxY protein [Chitinophagaceae bacterium]MBP8114722.1 GxxExxY protein [Chitinophagaceae bacterium]